MRRGVRSSSPKRQLSPKLANSPYLQSPFPIVMKAADREQHIMTNRAPIDPITPPTHNARQYRSLTQDTSYTERNKILALESQRFHNDLKKISVGRSTDSPYKDNPRATWEQARLIAEFREDARRRKEREDRSQERREYNENIKWQRRNAPTTTDLIFSKDPSIRIVPTEDRAQLARP